MPINSQVRQSLVRAAVLLSSSIFLAGTGDLPAWCDTANDNPTIDEIRDAWKERQEKLPPFMYKAHVTEDVAVYKPPATADPFAPRNGDSIGRLKASKEITVKWHGESYWCGVAGERVNADGAEVFGHTQQRAFDGKYYRDFIRSSRHPFALGHFGKAEDVQEIIERTGPGREFAAVVWWRGLNALIPEGKKVTNQRVLELKVFAGTVLVDQHPCIEMQYFFKGQLVQSLMLRRESPFLPMQVTRYSHDGTLVASYKPTYVESENATAQLATWSFLEYDGKGELERKTEGRVTEFMEGTKFSTSDFTLTFPIGTHVIEYTAEAKSGKRYWIQTSDSTLKPMDEEDYGRLPKSEGGSQSADDA